MESLFILALIAILAGPVLGLIALSQISDLKRQVAKLRAGVPLQSTPNAIVDPKVTSQVDAKAETKPAAPEKTIAAAPVEKAIEKPIIHKRDVEGTLASRWFVWVGGVAVALGGLLFVKYAHDNGLIPPVLRVIIGLGFAGALVAAGEWVRKNRGAAVQDYVPAALSAAGLVIAFGVVYAAYALYGLLGPGACFPALVAIGLSALWLSLRQGPLIAALGLLGAYVAPTLVPSEFPNPWGFFAFLFVIAAASLMVLRHRPWWWLGYAAVAGSVTWSMLWIFGGLFAPSHGLPVGVFALGLGLAASGIVSGRAILVEDMGSLLDFKKAAPQLRIAIFGLAGMALVLAFLVIGSAHGNMALGFFAIGMAAIVGFGWLRAGNVGAPLAASVASLLVLAIWPEVGFHSWAMDEAGLWSTVPGMIEPPRFRNAMLVALVAFTAIGILGVVRKSQSRVWAALASFSGVAFLFVLWGRADFVWSWQVWAVLAVVIAVILGGLGDRVKEKDFQATEYLLAGSALLLLFAIDRAFDGVVQTIAIAILAFGYAVMSKRIPSSWIATLATLIGTLAAVRLFAGREFWGEPTELFLGAHWVLYGYGVPAAVLWFGSRQLNAKTMARYRTALEGIALGLAISLVSLEIRVLIGGGITRDRFDLLELSAHALAWLGAAYGLAYRQQLFSSFVSLWGARVLLAAGCAALFIGLTVRNPTITGDTLAGGMIFNTLWLAYLAPVPLLVLMARKLDGLGLARFRDGLGVFALLLLLAFVTLWVKRLFEDATLVPYFVSDPQSWAVSAAWIALAIAIFVGGIRLDRQTIRYGGLAILVLAVLKVFALDLFELGGLWRIASIVGLGLCLIGVGWLYTRFIQKQEKAIS